MAMPFVFFLGGSKSRILPWFLGPILDESISKSGRHHAVRTRVGRVGNAIPCATTPRVEESTGFVDDMSGGNNIGKDLS